MHLEGLWLFTICVGLFIPLSFSWKGRKKSREPLLLLDFFPLQPPLAVAQAPFSWRNDSVHCSRASNKHGSLRRGANPMTTGTQWKVKLERLRGFCVFFVVEMPKKKRSFKWVFIFGGLADLIWHLLSHHKTLFFLVPKWLFFLQVLDIFRSQHPWPGDLEAVGKMNGFWLCRVSPCSQVCDVYDIVCFRVFRTVALNLPVSDWAYFSGKQKPRAFMSY